MGSLIIYRYRSRMKSSAAGVSQHSYTFNSHDLVFFFMLPKPGHVVLKKGYLKMRFSWSSTSLPGNRGLPALASSVEQRAQHVRKPRVLPLQQYGIQLDCSLLVSCSKHKTNSITCCLTSKYAPGRPHVYGCRVELGPKKDIWRSVPQCHYLVGDTYKSTS